MKRSKFQVTFGKKEIQIGEEQRKSFSKEGPVVDIRADDRRNLFPIFTRRVRGAPLYEIPLNVVERKSEILLFFVSFFL